MIVSKGAVAGAVERALRADAQSSDAVKVTAEQAETLRRWADQLAPGDRIMVGAFGDSVIGCPLVASGIDSADPGPALSSSEVPWAFVRTFDATFLTSEACLVLVVA